jgi:hypothetical protein
MVDSEVRARVGSRTDKTRAFLPAYLVMAEEKFSPPING